MIKNNKILIAIVILLALTAGICYFFFDINRIQGEELLLSSTSPSDSYTIEAYKNSGGATTDYAVLCRLHYNDESKKDRNIYWNYHCDEARIEWVDENTVIINGEIIDDVTKDKYDFRNE